ncbi:Xaa-Pro dipeptidase [Sulfidibacter corallicola]|uniref:Xaa-Pro dipeptidase n=1 Tax=Sulfidibacter corallicola TaxID=2818388 RepID=A0A8A4TVK4_SULCO|nr:Xaa-Pro dipeptidase [Sulfidibacter corallicola]QTD53397.1 Xaa-Pro dipeptidase [Sulfidibacter corallicola]
MERAKHFARHIAHVQGIYEQALATLSEEAQQMDAVLIHSGSEGIYFGDDRHIYFQAFGHFNHWVPLNRPDQMVLIQPGKKPTYFQVVRPDFWYDQTVHNEAWWADAFEIVSLTAPEQVVDHLPATRRIAFLGENLPFAAQIGMPSNLHNEKNLLNYLDYYRGMKTDYEVGELREANRIAMLGHEAARKSFFEHGSEYDINQAFLAATSMLETDSPYTNIVGLDRNAAILHYQYKQRDNGRESKTLLIDAGSVSNRYCSDITRTYTRDDSHPVFRAIMEGIERLQLALVDHAKIGSPYKELQAAAHDGVLDLLLQHEIVRGNREELSEHNQVSRLFFPHGIGHLLGLQVHDVGGFFKDDHGALAPPPEDHKFLRLNREMKQGMVFTIEPGLYFIPVLLDPERNSDLGKNLNWSLIDALIPYGGARFEDNILLGEDGPVNLTR